MALTEEQIQEALKTDAVKAAIKAATDEEVAGLKKKNGELLGSMKEIKDKLAAIEAEKEEIQQKSLEKTGDIEAIKTQLETKHRKEIEKLTSEKTALQTQLETHVIGEGLTKALVKANIQPQLMDAARALIKTTFKGEVSNENGSPVALFDGKKVDEFVTAWTQTEGGKHFVSANPNSGGGSNGANGTGKAGTEGKTSKTMTRTEFDALAPADKVKFSREGVKLVDN